MSQLVNEAVDESQPLLDSENSCPANYETARLHDVLQTNETIASSVQTITSAPKYTSCPVSRSQLIIIHLINYLGGRVFDSQCSPRCRSS